MRTYDKYRAKLEKKWVHCMQELGGYWRHDGNLKRPYARLTEGKISNFYADCTVITEWPTRLSEAASDLMSLYTQVGRPQVYLGSAYGAVNLAYELARGRGARAWYTVKGNGKTMMLDRFRFSPETKVFMICEDDITTFGTTRKTIEALRTRAQAEGVEITILPYVLAIVNRSRANIHDEFKIISLITEDYARDWEEGDSPFTDDKKELVRPLQPKKGNWDLLTKDY